MKNIINTKNNKNTGACESFHNLSEKLEKMKTNCNNLVKNNEDIIKILNDIDDICK